MRIPDYIPWTSTGKTLGRGGQGVVELVTRENDPEGPRYALKALNRVESSQARQRFRTEIEAIKSLTHEAIVPVVDQSEPGDDFQFYVMDYIEGAEPLEHVIFGSANPFHGNPLKSLDLLEQISSVIRAGELANPRIIHRDIKPNNILVVPDGGIRLIDFGICQIQDGMMVTLVDENVGARNYTSPECEAGNDGEVGIHSDIYSAGKVLWSAITSRTAFAREAPVFSNLSMKELFPDKPETWHLTHIFGKTIRETPSNRFGSADGLLKHIRDIRYVIQRQLPPLEEIQERCPSCGWKDLERNFSGAHVIFGNPNPRGTDSYRCKFCGFVFARDTNIWRENVNRIRDLN